MQRIRNIDEIIINTLLEQSLNTVWENLRHINSIIHITLFGIKSVEVLKLPIVLEECESIDIVINTILFEKRTIQSLGPMALRIAFKNEYDKNQVKYRQDFLWNDSQELWSEYPTLKRKYFPIDLQFWCVYNSKKKKVDYKYSRYDSWLLDTRKKNYLEKLQLEWGIYFCPYCGKNTIIHFWIEAKKFKRLYDIEHFLPRSKYSSLSINLYNRLPACMSCNQRLKWTKDPLESDDKIFHPYFWWIGGRKNQERRSELKIRVCDISLDKIITFVKKQKSRSYQLFALTSKHWKFFQLDNIYLNSEDTFQIFHFIYDKYTKIKDEYQRFKKNTKSIEAFIEHFFASYYPKCEQDILKYSNGKYKKDLIQYMRQLLKSWKQTLPDQN